MSTPAATVALNNDVSVLLVGFDVYQAPAEETEQVVIEALAVGQWHLDTAAVCGNESGTGARLGQVIGPILGRR